jgi:hypothetical protein
MFREIADSTELLEPVSGYNIMKMAGCKFLSKEKKKIGATISTWRDFCTNDLNGSYDQYTIHGARNVKMVS